MPNETLNVVQQQLLEPIDLDQHRLSSVLGSLMDRQVDFADIFCQSKAHESWSLEDGLVKDAQYNVDQGVGVRAISGEQVGFAYSNDMQLQAIQQSASAAKAIARRHQTQSANLSMPQPTAAYQRYSAINPITSYDRQQKIDLLRSVDAKARQLDSRVQQVMASLNAVYELVYVMASDGTLGCDVRPLIRFNVQVIMADDSRREVGYNGSGGRMDFDTFFASVSADDVVQEAVRQAQVNMQAEEAPAGAMPVVLGPGWPGVLLHEAVGHGLEGDFNRKGSSVFSGRLGQQVASPLCTIVDDGTIDQRRGSLSMDDEGLPGQYNTLIENGILKRYMQDKLNARLMGVEPTGNGRRESYAHTVMPRMTNTYMLPGDDDPADIIHSVEDGIYAVNFGGGQVDITSGQFVFSANEAYRIQNGRITHPIKGATLIGSGAEVLKQVSRVGHDWQLDGGIGTCGKDGQSVPVGVGQPTLKVDSLTVGGTQS